MPDPMGGLRIKGDRSGWVRAVPTEKRGKVPWHVADRPIGATNDADRLVTTTEKRTVDAVDENGRPARREETVAVQRWEYELDPSS
jgi:hypothetical protein